MHQRRRPRHTKHVLLQRFIGCGHWACQWQWCQCTWWHTHSPNHQQHLRRPTFVPCTRCCLTPPQAAPLFPGPIHRRSVACCSCCVPRGRAATPSAAAGGRRMSRRRRRRRLCRRPDRRRRRPRRRRRTRRRRPGRPRRRRSVKRSFCETVMPTQSAIIIHNTHLEKPR